MKETVQWLKKINVNVVLGLIAVVGLILAYQNLVNTIRAENAATRVELRAEFRAEIGALDAKVNDLQSDVNDLRVEMIAMESRLTESFDKRLDAVEREQARLQGLYDALPK